MNKCIKNNLVVAVLATSLMILLTIVDALIGQPSDSSGAEKWFAYGILSLGPIGFYIVNYQYFKDSERFFKIFLPIVITAGLSVVWFFIMITIVGNFMFFIGGH